MLRGSDPGIFLGAGGGSVNRQLGKSLTKSSNLTKSPNLTFGLF